MLKSFLLFLAIGFITFGATCGGTILMFTGGAPFGLLLIISGLITLHQFCRYFLGIYTGRYFGIIFMTGILLYFIWGALLYFIYMIPLTGNNQIIGNISLIPPLLILVFYIYVFHFYRMKFQTETLKSGTIGSDLSLILQGIFDPITTFFGGKQKHKKQEFPIEIHQEKIENPQTIDLMSVLLQVDISNVISITFLPTAGRGFSIKTPKIKRLAIYITRKLGKTIFEAEELRKAFDHVIINISSDLSKTDFNLIRGKMSEFVTTGGEVKINKV